MLTDFFRINMPYGMSRNSEGEWTFFNREYLPLGWNCDPYELGSPEKETALSKLPIYIKYKGLTNAKLTSLAHHEKYGLQHDDTGEIVKVFFYNDGSNPESYPAKWPEYFDKIKALSKCQIKKPSDKSVL